MVSKNKADKITHLPGKLMIIAIFYQIILVIG